MGKKNSRNRKQKKKKKISKAFERRKKHLTLIRKEMVDDLAKKNYGGGEILIYLHKYGDLEYFRDSSNTAFLDHERILLRLNPSIFESEVTRFETREEAAKIFVKNNVKNNSILEQMKMVQNSDSVEDILSNIRDY